MYMNNLGSGSFLRRTLMWHLPWPIRWLNSYERPWYPQNQSSQTHSWPTKLWDWVFKPLNFGVCCYTKINNYYMKNAIEWDKKGAKGWESSKEATVSKGQEIGRNKFPKRQNAACSQWSKLLMLRIIFGVGDKNHNIHLKYIFITASNITVSLPQSKLALSLVHETVF